MITRNLLAGIQRVIPYVIIVPFIGCAGASGVRKLSGDAGISTHEQFIAGLYSPIAGDEPGSVFRHVFASLNAQVNIYPSENYYYFLCSLHGRQLSGSIALFADGRDAGKLSFSYEEVTTSATALAEPHAVDIELSEKNGVRVRKLSETRYAVTYSGRTVTFVLRDDATSLSSTASPPHGAEILMGSTFDESGLRFNLYFNHECTGFYWVLREDQYVPEEFISHAADVVIGRRTGFVFYIDPRDRRKVLIGVSMANVNVNNWYDGPFDQLPDNAIKRGELDLKEYLEARYPDTRGRINRYGVFKDNPEMRVAIAPYLQYSSMQEVARLAESIRAGVASREERCLLTSALRRAESSPHDFDNAPAER